MSKLRGMGKPKKEAEEDETASAKPKKANARKGQEGQARVGCRPKQDDRGALTCK